jgi:plastocyanin
MLRHLTAVTYSQKLALATGLALFFGTSTQAADWADLQITFVYDAAKAPARSPVDMSRDPVCVQAHPDAKPLSEELLVDPASMGIKNVAFYPDTKKSGLEASDVHPDLKKPSDKPVTLDNNQCVFVPHMFVVHPNQTINVLNSDKAGHNANFEFINNEGMNPLIPPGGSKDVKFPLGERTPSRVTCSIHPWMSAYLLMFDLPYAGFSDEKGVLKIEKLPAGKPITFKLWHENMEKSIDEVTIGGKAETWTKGNVELTLKPGMNDLGVVKIKPDKFKTK